jgi:hypothetical protein
MSLSRRVLVRWVQLAAVATPLSLMVYIAAQQIGRQMANDPQIQLAGDARAALAAGASVESVVPTAQVDIRRSLAPWVTVLNDSGTVIASSARMRGEMRSVPQGVLDHARQTGEERVTWQPEPGVRMATVLVRVGGTPTRFVLAGRSLRETESRISQLGRLLAVGWLATLAGLLIVVAASESFLGSDVMRL